MQIRLSINGQITSNVIIQKLIISRGGYGSVSFILVILYAYQHSYSEKLASHLFGFHLLLYP